MILLDLEKIEGFEWDKGNLVKNWQKHKVTEKETEEVFFNEYVIFFDKKHSQTEERYVLYGATHNKRLLTVIFTIRKSFIRIISARDQSKKEKAYYFKNKKLSI